MLDSCVDQTAAVTSETAAWDPASVHVISAPAQNPLFFPAEPSTLTLAIIGAGIIGIYRRVRKPPESPELKAKKAAMLQRRWYPEPLKRRDAA
jgi:hypothetical protein